jgi:hypothetical protein
MRNSNNKYRQSLTEKLESNRELFKQFECQHLSSEEKLVVYPCALPFRSTMVLQSVYGTEIKTKEVLNVVDQKTQCSYTVYGDKLGVTDISVVVVLNGRPHVARITFGRNHQTKKRELTMDLKGTSYRILFIDGHEASFQSPHLMG